MEDHQTPQKNHSRQSDSAKDSTLNKSLELKPNPPSSQITINSNELSTKHRLSPDLSRPEVPSTVRFQAIRGFYNTYFDISGCGTNIRKGFLVAVILSSVILGMSSVLLYSSRSDKYTRSLLQVSGSFAAAGIFFGLISLVWSGDTVPLRCSRCVALLAMPIGFLIYWSILIREPGNYILIGVGSAVFVVSLLLKKNGPAQVQPQP